MRLELTPRLGETRALGLLAPPIALAVAFLLGGVVVALMGRSPLAALQVYLVEPLRQGWSVEEIVVKAAPLALIATGLSFCFRANRWNIGAEGQFVMGGLAGGLVAILTPASAQGAWTLPAMLLAGTAAGMAYGALPAVLRNRFGASEILTSLMLVYVAELTLDYLVRGPLRDPKGFNFPQSVTFPDAAVLPLLTGGRLHAGVPLALLVVVIAAFALRFTRFGFAIRVSGEAPKAAAFAGFDEKRITLWVFMLSGALAGLAGVSEVSGQIGQLKPVISPGYGFTAIIVAFLGRLSPIGILLSAFVISLVTIGAEGAQITLKLPLDLARAFQGLLLFCVLAAETLARFRVRLAS